MFLATIDWVGDHIPHGFPQDVLFGTAPDFQGDRNFRDQLNEFVIEKR